VDYDPIFLAWCGCSMSGLNEPDIGHFPIIGDLLRTLDCHNRHGSDRRRIRNRQQTTVISLRGRLHVGSAMEAQLLISDLSHIIIISSTSVHVPCMNWMTQRRVFQVHFHSLGHAAWWKSSKQLEELQHTRYPILVVICSNPDPL